ncbi:MAG: hydrolase [Oscillospiraceae bacterium]|jgi:hypothetical protein|nr:hydrolase [Oscillospiraceae bacterium]
MNLQIKISRGGTVYIPAVTDGAVWETEIAGAPGRFVFSVRDGGALRMDGGDAVSVTGDGQNVFFGYIFTRRADQTGTASVTAYDQTRYLKNRDTCVYDGITASALLRRVAADNGLRTGTIDDTGVLLEPCAEDNKSLADILRNALARTEAAGGGRFVLYDDFGELTLRRAGEMRRGLLIGSDGGRTFTRTATIDWDTYNTVKLVCDKKKGRTVHTASDAQNVSRWGKLQYFGKLADDFNGGAKAGELLRLHNRERRELFVGGAPGDCSVRAGCSLAVSGELTGGGDAPYTVERARHVWKNGRYFMDLTLTEV